MYTTQFLRRPQTAPCAPAFGSLHLLAQCGVVRRALWPDKTHELLEQREASCCRSHQRYGGFRKLRDKFRSPCNRGHIIVYIGVCFGVLGLPVFGNSHIARHSHFSTIPTSKLGRYLTKHTFLIYSTSHIRDCRFYLQWSAFVHDSIQTTSGRRPGLSKEASPGSQMNGSLLGCNIMGR